MEPYALRAVAVADGMGCVRRQMPSEGEAISTPDSWLIVLLALFLVSSTTAGKGA